MSVLRELEQRIEIYAPMQSYAQIVNDVLRVNDCPHDAVLYAELIATYANFYMRVAESKAYKQEMAESAVNGGEDEEDS